LADTETIQSGGLFSKNIGADAASYALLALVVTGACFFVRCVARLLKEKKDRHPFNPVRTLRAALLDCCWLMPLAMGFVLLSMVQKSIRLSFTDHVVSVYLFTILFTWPILLAALIIRLLYRWSANAPDEETARRRDLALCCLLAAVIAAQEIYILAR
jgi:hypothetical protein